MSRTPTPRPAEKSLLGPQWKTEARGVWRRDFRTGATAPAGGSGVPTVLRIRETRNGFTWELWRGPTLTQMGEAKAADEAGDYAEFAANANATPGTARRSQPQGPTRFVDDPAPARPSPAWRNLLFVTIALSWFAHITALWLGVANPWLTGVSLIATMSLLWLLLVRRVL